jgi:O-antigen ligase
MSLSTAAPPMSPLRRYWRDRALWMTIADTFAILVALALPWSTSLVAILVPCWLGAVAWVMDWRAYGRLLKLPICYLPLALVGLALVGTLWSDAAWGARLYAIGPPSSCSRCRGCSIIFSAHPAGCGSSSPFWCPAAS